MTAMVMLQDVRKSFGELTVLDGLARRRLRGLPPSLIAAMRLGLLGR